MLKIKNNVDLKELKKFGFIYYPNGYENCLKVFENSMIGDVKIRITNNRTIYPVVDLGIYNMSHQSEFDLYDTLYDLIKADLVEKVEENIIYEKNKA